MTATLTFGLSRSTLLKIQGVFAQHPAIDSAVVYGSRAMGNYKPGSDIDLSLHGAALTLDDLSAVTEGLEELLLPYEIDLSVFSQIDNVLLREHIQRVGQTIYLRGDTANVA